MRRFTTCSIALIVLAIAGSTRADTYSIVDLDTLGGTISHAFGMNTYGDVVGSSTIASGIQHAFLYHNGTMSDLGVLSGDTSSIALGINDSGLIVGSSHGATSRAFYSIGGPMQFLGSLGGTYGFATAVNNVGQVVGISADENGTSHAFKYASGVMSDLGHLPGGDYSIAYGINSLGDVTGYATTNASGHYDAFLYTGGSLQNLGDLGDDSRGFKINDGRYVVGDAIIDVDGHERVLLWHDGTYTNLGITGDAVSADGGNLNSFNQVVGTLIFDLLDGSKNHGFLYANGTMIDVNTLLPQNSGWVLRDAQAINDRGQIVGFGNINGEQHAYLLAPLQGDYNRNGVVDDGDYLIWRKNVGNVVSPCSGGDANCNGFVENAEYQPWRANYGRVAGTGSGAVANATIPEPATAVLLMFAAAGWCLRRRRGA